MVPSRLFLWLFLGSCIATGTSGKGLVETTTPMSRHVGAQPLNGTSTSCVCPPPSSTTPSGPPGRWKWKIFKKKIPEEPIEPLEFWLILFFASLLVVIGGIFAGLTIGLMSLDATNLSILMASGTPKQKKYAQRIEPIRKNTHLLLVTLLLGNTIVNESLPVLLHAIRLDGYQAVLLSTALIVLFGEIIPQAFCVRYGLSIGAFFAWPVRILMWIISPVAYPVAMLLDWILGHQNGVVYRRAELKELVALHGEDQAGTLNKDEVSIVRAVLDLRDKTVDQIMTKMEDVFMLPLSARLDVKTIQLLMEKGHSRVPIYHESPQNVIGVVLVKTLVPYDPDEAIPLSSLKIRRLPRVQASTPLFEILHIFEEGGSHMALVVEEVGLEESLSLPQIIIPDSPLWVSGHLEKGPHKMKYKAIGIVTMEDVIEELLGEEIIDETDVYVDMNTKIEVSRRPLSAIPRVLSTLAVVPSPLSLHPSPRLAPTDDERAPLLTPLANSLDASGNNSVAGNTSEALLTPRLRPRGTKRRKTKELIEASKLATDVSPNDRPVRPSSLLFRSGSSLGPVATTGSPHRRVPTDTDTYIRIIAEEDGFVIDGQPQILEWSLDGEPSVGGG